ncbi:MAG: Copper binding protein plastocyanin/azurin family, partial [Bacteroidetes bacterium]|nr:Copper binding protein plastocyanin/azurin family [Bacteroidota bacterium]
GSFASPTMGGGATYSHQFTTAGTYTYSCTFHPGMNGTVIVQ